jgi:UDP-N-acetylglucosamine 2-epimerase
MSQVFFDELGLPEPDFRLEVGSGGHGEQTGRMLAGLERILVEHRPDAVLVYGDTNSTLAGALAAAKLNIPLFHVEAGLRSHDRGMPEEINRVLADRLSSLLLCPTAEALRHLAAEGIVEGVHQVGDVMYDAAVHFGDQAGEASQGVLGQLRLSPGGYVLWTCHRAANTDDPMRFAAIMDAVRAVAQETPVVFPVHPRLKKGSELFSRAKNSSDPFFIEPVSYLEMLALERHARVVVTDSGGIQKEAFIFGVPCVTIRDRTEWTETVEAGANQLVPADRGRIVEAIRRQAARRDRLPDAGGYYGNGHAVDRVVRRVAEMLGVEEAKPARPAA